MWEPLLARWYDLGPGLFLGGHANTFFAAKETVWQTRGCSIS